MHPRYRPRSDPPRSSRLVTASRLSHPRHSDRKCTERTSTSSTESPCKVSSTGSVPSRRSYRRAHLRTLHSTLRERGRPTRQLRRRAQARAVVEQVAREARPGRARSSSRRTRHMNAGVERRSRWPRVGWQPRKSVHRGRRARRPRLTSRGSGTSPASGNAPRALSRAHRPRMRPDLRAKAARYPRPMHTRTAAMPVRRASIPRVRSTSPSRISTSPSSHRVCASLRPSRTLPRRRQERTDRWARRRRHPRLHSTRSRPHRS